MKAARGMGLSAFVAALLLHAGLLSALFAADAPRREPPRKPPVRIRVAPRPEIPKPVPEPVLAPAPEPEPAPPSVAMAIPRPEPPRPREEKPRKKPQEPPPQPKLAPPPAAEPAAPPPEVAPAPAVSDAPSEPPRPARKFTVALDATVTSGGVAVPVSPGGSGFAFGTPDGDPDAEPRLPSGRPARTIRTATLDGPAATGPARPYEVAELTRAPRPLAQPPPERLRALYPEAARKANLEANVSLRLLISAQGEVVEARLVRGAGNGFDEVALRLAREIRFAPGERGGKPVEVWIPWTFRFRLDG